MEVKFGNQTSDSMSKMGVSSGDATGDDFDLGDAASNQSTEFSIEDLKSDPVNDGQASSQIQEIKPTTQAQGPEFDQIYHDSLQKKN